MLTVIAYAGMCFGDVPFLYPEAIILGVTIKGRVCLNPRLDYRSVLLLAAQQGAVTLMLYLNVM